MSADVSNPRRAWPFPAQDLEQQPEVRTLMARAFEEGADAMERAAIEAVRVQRENVLGFLCQAWGESDYTAAALVQSREQVIEFLIEEQWSPPMKREGMDEHHRGVLDEQIAEMDEALAIGNEWDLSFEIGGISVNRATFWVSRPAPTAPSEEGSPT